MRKRSIKQTFADNIEVRKRQLEADLDRARDTASRERLKKQIDELETARHMEGWLRASQLRPPEGSPTQ